MHFILLMVLDLQKNYNQKSIHFVKGIVIIIIIHAFYYSFTELTFPKTLWPEG